MRSNGKAKARKKSAAKDLTAKNAPQVTGGRKKGGSQQEQYLEVKLDNVLISGY